MIEIRSLNAGYNTSKIIFGVNFDAKKNEITAIIGPNGSGKSTLLKSIFGLATVYSGQIMYKDTNITNLAPHQIAKSIAYMSQLKNIFANLTIKENLIMAGYTLDRKTAKDRIPEIFKIFPILTKFKNSRAETMSGGQRQMLGMGMALIRKPEIMLFDEPTASLSPKLANEVLDKVREMRDDFGISVILVEQNIQRALTIADTVYLLANGKNVFEGKPDELLKRKALAKMYLGLN